MPPLRPSDIPWNEPILPPPVPIPRELAALGRAAYGPAAWPASFGHAPWFQRSAFEIAIVTTMYSQDELANLLHLVIAQDNSCRFCYGTSRFILRSLGYSEETVRALEHDLLDAGLDPKLVAALEYARDLSRASPRPGAARFDALVAAGWPEARVRQLAGDVALWVFAIRITTLFAVPPVDIVERAQDRWFAPLMHLVGRLMVALERPPPIEPCRLPVGDVEAVVAGLGDGPMAHATRRLLTEAFGPRPGPLPLRTRLVVGAVIGRAIGCEAGQRALTAVVAADGIDAARVERMLATLDADWLDDRERGLVSVARDTVRPHLPTVQQRMAEAKSRLSDAEFVDFVGVASAANALARLTVLADRC
jgi:alkylhydroperoxidase family enzyme